MVMDVFGNFHFSTAVLRKFHNTSKPPALLSLSVIRRAASQVATLVKIGAERAAEEVEQPMESFK